MKATAQAVQQLRTLQDLNERLAALDAKVDSLTLLVEELVARRKKPVEVPETVEVVEEAPRAKHSRS